jgi:hypothetical protein
MHISAILLVTTKWIVKEKEVEERKALTSEVIKKKQIYST